MPAALRLVRAPEDGVGEDDRRGFGPGEDGVARRRVADLREVAGAGERLRVAQPQPGELGLVVLLLAVQQPERDTIGESVAHVGVVDRAAGSP